MISVSFYHSGVAFDSVSFLEDIKKGSREAEGCTVTNGHIDLKIPWQSQIKFDIIPSLTLKEMQNGAIP